MTITEQNEALVEAGRLNQQMQDISNKAEKEKRGYTPEEDTLYAKLEADYDAVKMRVDRAVKNSKRGTELEGYGNSAVLKVPVDSEGNPIAKKRPNEGAEYLANFEMFLREGEGRVSTKVKNSLVKATGTLGGYLAPVEYEKAIIEKAYPITLMRQYATVDTSSSDSSIVMEGNLPTFGWIDELGTYPKTDISFANAGMSAWKEGGIILVSEELMADSFLNLPSYIAKKSATAIAQADDAVFFLGDGNKKPKGIVSDATLGAAAASTSTVTSDEMLDFMDALPEVYEAKAILIMRKVLRSKLRKLKDTTGQYLWQPGLQAGVPDQFNGKEVKVTPYLGALTANSVPAIYGDISFYQILDRAGMYIQQLNELYAENGQVGFKINKREDGKLLNPSAVVKLQMAAA